MTQARRAWPEENYVLISDLFNRSYDERIMDIKEKIKRGSSSYKSFTLCILALEKAK